jgi:hypothetical protein
MRRTARPSLAALIACVAVLCATMPRPAVPRHLQCAVDPPATLVTPATALPAGLEPPDADRRWPLVAAVAADIDDDGDLDAVASDGSLHLIVWANDGTGRLTRQSPKQSLPGGVRLAYPTVDGNPVGSRIVAQLTGSAATTLTACAGPAPREAPWRPADIRSRPHRQIISSRVPRAPPSSPVLT